MPPTAPKPEAPTPAYIRIAVVVGLVTLVIGVAGMFMIDRPLPTFIQLHGVAEELELHPSLVFEIEASWEDDEGELHGEAGTGGREPDVWLFYDVPVDRDITLVVYRLTEAERREVMRRTQPLPQGTLVGLSIQR